MSYPPTSVPQGARPANSASGLESDSATLGGQEQQQHQQQLALDKKPDEGADLEKADGMAPTTDEDDEHEKASSMTPPEQGQQPPQQEENAAEAWLVVLGAWCTSVCSFGWINSVGTFQEYYEVGPLSTYSPSTIAWIPSLQVFFMAAMGPIVGKLFDSYGPRQLIIVGTFMHVFGLMMASISTEYYQFLLSQGVCSAIGVSAIFQPAIACIPGRFINEKRGIAYGVVATGSSIGGVIFPILVSRLIASAGYGWAMRASAFLILGLLVIAIATVREPPSWRAQRKARRAAGEKQMSRAQLTKPFRERGFVGLLVGMFLMPFGVYVPITYLVAQAVAEAHVDPQLAQYLVAMLNAGSLFGRLLSGWASDRAGKYNSFVVSCYAAGIFILALWIPGGTSQSATIAFAVLFGFFSGAYVSLIGSLVAQVSPHAEIGFRTGLVFLVSSVPGLTTGPIAGAILTRYGSWADLKVFGGVLCLAGTTVVLITRFSYTGLKLKAIF